MNLKTNSKNIFFYTCLVILYFIPFFVFLFPFLPQKLASLGYLIFVLALSYRIVKNKNSLYVLIILVVFLLGASLFYDGINYFILTAGIFAFGVGFLTIILFRDNQLNTGEVKNFFAALLVIGIVQLPVNIFLIRFLAGDATPDSSLYIIDICFGTFGFKRTGQLGIYSALLIFILVTAFQKYNRSFLYWSVIMILLIVQILTHSGGSVVLLLAALGMWVVFNFNRTEILKTLVTAILLVVLSVATFSSIKAVMPEDRKELMRDFENIFSYSLKHFMDNTNVLIVPEHESPNKLDGIKKAFEFALEEGNAITGTQAGILRNYFYSYIESVENAYLTDKAFPGIHRNYTSGYSIILGESGLLGIVLILVLFLYLCFGNFSSGNSRTRKIKFILLVIFVVYNFYRFSFFDYQFTFLWAFLYFNVEKIADLDFNFMNRNKKVI